MKPPIHSHSRGSNNINNGGSHSSLNGGGGNPFALPKKPDFNSSNSKIETETGESRIIIKREENLIITTRGEEEEVHKEEEKISSESLPLTKKEEAEEGGNLMSRSTSASSSRTPLDGNEKDQDEDEDEDEEPVRSNRKITPPTTTTTTTKKTPNSKRGRRKNSTKEETTSLNTPRLQLIGDLPLAEETASKTYTEIPESLYFSKNLGNLPYYDSNDSRCDCTWRPNEEISKQACGEYSDCMNRMLQMECEKGECRCGGKCQNQR
jgi:hypothetical protein